MQLKCDFICVRCLFAIFSQKFSYLSELNRVDVGGNITPSLCYSIFFMRKTIFFGLPGGKLCEAHEHNIHFDSICFDADGLFYPIRSPFLCRLQTTF